MLKDSTFENYFINGIIIWQSKVIFQCLFSRYDTAVFLGEMTIISTWVAAICRLRRKKVIFWGHGLYGNERGKKLVRITFYKLVHRHLLYENRARKLMGNSGFQLKNLLVIYNALDYERKRNFDYLESEKPNSLLNDFFKDKDLPILIFIGRLTKQKIHLLIEVLERSSLKLLNIIY